METVNTKTSAATGCCAACSADIDLGQGQRRSALITVLVINAVMFAGELGAGLWAHSSALQADSIDMLIDAIGIGASLFALNRTATARARAGFTNASLELVLAAAILVQLAFQIAYGILPQGGIMLVVGAMALAANMSCAWLLMRFRHEDISMRALWLCTRNDAIGNAATVVAGVIVLAGGWAWPDWLVGALIACLFIRTSVGLMRDSWRSI